jgi:hypothetical protein
MEDEFPWAWTIHPVLPDADYTILASVGVDPFDPENWNADVQVIRDEMAVWSATFYTLANLYWLFDKNAATGECSGGLYYNDKHMVIVRRIDRETIEATVAAIFAEHEFEWGDDAAFSTEPVLRQQRPILLVRHAQDGHWQFLDGGEFDFSDATLLHPDSIFGKHPDVETLADLPRGWAAERNSVEAEWHRYEWSEDPESAQRRSLFF